MKGIDPVLMLQPGWGADGYIVKNWMLPNHDEWKVHPKVQLCRA